MSDPRNRSFLAHQGSQDEHEIASYLITDVQFQIGKLMEELDWENQDEAVGTLSYQKEVMME